MSLTDAMKAALEAAGKAQFSVDLADEHTLFVIGSRLEVARVQPVTVKPVVDDDVTWSEVMTLMTISHPNITQIKDVCRFEFEGRKYLAVVEEPVQRTLAKEMRERAERNEPFDENEVVFHGKALIEALAFLQARGIAHRSIHPENIFIAERMGVKELKLGNFWWSLLQQHDEMKTLSLSDVSQYSSPLVQVAQQRREKYVRHNPYKSDVYSLGRVLKFMGEGWNFKPQSLGERLSELVSEMTRTEEEERPTFAQLSLKYSHCTPSPSTEPETPRTASTRKAKGKSDGEERRDSRLSIAANKTCTSCAVFCF